MPGPTTAATTATFPSLVLAATKPVLVDFWASWCAPCLALAPVLDDIAEDYADVVQVVKVDAEAEAALMAQYQVKGLPSLILFHHGEEIARVIGAQTRTRLAALLDANL